MTSLNALLKSLPRKISVPGRWLFVVFVVNVVNVVNVVVVALFVIGCIMQGVLKTVATFIS